MSHISNPYAQGQWSGGSYWQQALNAHPPTYGALPSLPAVGSASTMTFQFNTNGGGPLDSTVTDAIKTYFHISTRAVNGVRVTRFSLAESGALFATIEWHDQAPFVAVGHRVPRQDATRWLMFSHDRSTASMGIGHELFIWANQGGSIKLYKRTETGTSECLGRLYLNGTLNRLCLDLHVSLLQTSGNLEIFIVAAAMLQSQSAL